MQTKSSLHRDAPLRPAAVSRSGVTPVAALLAALILAIISLPLLVNNDFLIHSLIMVMYFAYLASAWNLMCGYVGQISFGHSVFSGVGGYCSVLLLTGMGLSPWLGMFAGGALAAVLAVMIGFPTMRLRGPYFALTTIAVAEMIRIWVENTDEFYGIRLKGAEGLSVPLIG